MTSDQGVFIPGGGTGVLLLQDLGGPVTEAHALAQCFARVGFSVYCPGPEVSYCEHGAPGWSGAGAVLEAERAISRLRAHCPDVIVAGAGYGAMLALEVARQNAGTVQALVLLDPRWSVLPLPGRLVTAMTGWLPQTWLVQFANWARRLPHTAAKVPAGSGVGITTLLELASLMDCARHALPSVMQPTLLFHHRAHRGRADNAVLLQRRLGGRVESVMIDDSAHPEAHWRLTADVVERSARFVRAVLDESEAKRGNQVRRRRLAGQSNAA